MRLVLAPAFAAAFMAKGMAIGIGVGAVAGGLAACACRRVGRRAVSAARRAEASTQSEQP